MVDDFHGGREWASFMAGIRKIFPERDAVEIPDEDAIFNVLRPRSPSKCRAPGRLRSGVGAGRDRRPLARNMDDKGKVQVAICFNMDLGDAWEWADAPNHPKNLLDSH